MKYRNRSSIITITKHKRIFVSNYLNFNPKYGNYGDIFEGKKCYKFHDAFREFKTRIWKRKEESKSLRDMRCRIRINRINMEESYKFRWQSIEINPIPYFNLSHYLSGCQKCKDWLKENCIGGWHETYETWNEIIEEDGKKKKVFINSLVYWFENTDDLFRFKLTFSGLSYSFFD